METRQLAPPKDSDDSLDSDATGVAALLTELNPSTDLVSLVKRVHRKNLPWIVVPILAVAAWEQRDPSGWAKVLTWLEAKGITVERI